MHDQELVAPHVPQQHFDPSPPPITEPPPPRTRRRVMRRHAVHGVAQARGGASRVEQDASPVHPSDEVGTVPGLDAEQMQVIDYDDRDAQHDLDELFGKAESSLQQTGQPRIFAASSSSTALAQPA
eukprot:2888428-Pyramimonas_sp.AAC.1